MLIKILLLLLYSININYNNFIYAKQNIIKNDYDEILLQQTSRQLLSSTYFTSESENTITTSPDDPRSVFAIDIDDDGDIDVLIASNRDDTVSWCENNGSESFTEHVITRTADAARVCICDRYRW